MAISPIRIQHVLSLTNFQAEYGTEAQCEALWLKASGLNTFGGPICSGHISTEFMCG